MATTEEELYKVMRKYPRHSNEWDKLYQKWCLIQRHKIPQHKPVLEKSSAFNYMNEQGESYKIKTKYL